MTLRNNLPKVVPDAALSSANSYIATICLYTAHALGSPGALEEIVGVLKKHAPEGFDIYMAPTIIAGLLEFSEFFNVSNGDLIAAAQDELALSRIRNVAHPKGELIEEPVRTCSGRAFVEVSIHPFVERIADEDGEPLEGGECEWFNASGSEYGDELDDYPDDQFRKGWSVTSWVQDDEGMIDEVDDEEFLDFESAMARADELAEKYRVDIDHRY